MEHGGTNRCFLDSYLLEFMQKTQSNGQDTFEIIVNMYPIYLIQLSTFAIIVTT